MYRVHNSTVSKQLRYSLSQESVHHSGSSDEVPYAVVECRLGVTRGAVLKIVISGEKKILEEKEEVIAPIYEAALSMKPDYDVEKIYELLEKNKKLA